MTDPKTDRELVAEFRRLHADRQAEMVGGGAMWKLAADRLEALTARLERAEDFVTRHYLDTRMGEAVLKILTEKEA